MQKSKSARRAFKRVLSLVLALVLLAAVMPTALTVSAATINWHYDGDVVIPSPLDKNENSYAFSSYWDVVSSSRATTLINRSSATDIRLKSSPGTGDILILIDTTNAATAQKAFTKMNFVNYNNSSKVYNNNLRLEQIYYTGLGRNVFAVRYLGAYPEYPQVTLTYNRASSTYYSTNFTATVVNPGKDFAGSWTSARGESGTLLGTKYSVVEDDNSGAMVVKAVYTYSSRTGHGYDFSPVEFKTASGAWTSGSLLAASQESICYQPNKSGTAVRFSNLIVGSTYTDGYSYTNTDIMKTAARAKSKTVSYDFYPSELKTVQYSDTSNGVFSWEYVPYTGTITFYVSNGVFQKYMDKHNALTGKDETWKNGGAMLLWMNMYDVLYKINSKCGTSFTTLPLGDHVEKIRIYIGATKAYQQTSYFTDIYALDYHLPQSSGLRESELYADINNYSFQKYYVTSASFWYEAMTRASAPAGTYDTTPDEDILGGNPGGPPMTGGVVPEISGW